MTQPHLVIIGSGMAGGRLLDEIIRRQPERFKISVFGEERHPNYNRIMLSPLLAGDVSKDDIVLNSHEWYAKHNITLFAGERIIDIDRTQKCLHSDTGTELNYDHLVFATGSRPAKIQASGQQLSNIFDFRTLEDVDAILDSAQSATHAVVIGGGLLGLEAAYGLAVNGMKTTVIHRSGHLLNRQLDAPSAEMLRLSLKERGIDTLLNTEVAAFHGDSAVTSMTLKKGGTLLDEKLHAELVIIATGITPNTRLAQSAGLAVNRGIVVDDNLVTSDVHISALGECIEHRGETFGLVAPIWDQARILADRLVFGVESAYATTATPTKLKISGIDLFSAGEVDGNADDRTLVLQDKARRAYRKLIIRNHIIVGIVLFGDVQDGNWYFELLEQQAPIKHLLPCLLFGQSYCSNLQDTHDSTRHLFSDKEHQPDTALTGASV
ncbi:NAD(P)/FAD-dependent oxidoreductase [Neptunomonas antarctica]|uniref:Assimilatory nitrate reductase (NADH) beta subunit n=1 Tax=Neptunomonas antarctica TaxID=619304 RepID=A0A1N7L3M4_9GAMM|nr:FAD-dependent oxidoreductase [Neptunomonas antarctica]SIS68280.1 assimilatory nitrate reductase (NADH) beta subunit [Neptunomonas antarctica]